MASATTSIAVVMANVPPMAAAKQGVFIAIATDQLTACYEQCKSQLCCVEAARSLQTA
eukprot:m.353451 g.353451  ORF g.353451 m.353451 type:complete len:58 (+) comp19905_c0_seq23:1665-1838(+)